MLAYRAAEKYERKFIVGQIMSATSWNTVFQVYFCHDEGIAWSPIQFHSFRWGVVRVFDTQLKGTEL